MVKKGQAALEFLVTYGWAFIVILFAIGALYLLVIPQSSLIAPSCEFSGGLSCLGFQFREPNGVRVELQNNFGRPINITRIDCIVGATSGSANLNVELNAGAISHLLTCVLNDDVLSRGDFTNANVVVYFIPDGQQFPRTAEGNVMTNVD